MGLFDTISDKLFCPFCGSKQDSMDFQTKDLGCMMEIWTIKDIKQFNDYTRIYSKCKKCGEWIELIIEGEKNEA